MHGNRKARVGWWVGPSPASRGRHQLATNNTSPVAGLVSVGSNPPRPGRAQHSARSVRVSRARCSSHNPHPPTPLPTLVNHGHARWAPWPPGKRERCYKILSCDQLPVTPKGHTPWETVYPLYKYMTFCNKDDSSVICQFFLHRSFH
jgi:hypothetical protein